MQTIQGSRFRPALLTIGTLVAGVALLSTAGNSQEPKPSTAAAGTIGRQLIQGFTVNSPFDPDAPDHLWLDNDDGTYLFLHFDKPIAEASRLIYVGWAVPGTWCAEEQPKAFTHFHRTAKVGAWNAGHGGVTPGERGYWLKHVAVEEFDFKMMGMNYRVKPGTDLKFMPTNPPRCG